jgi:hypothetical protein
MTDMSASDPGIRETKALVVPPVVLSARTFDHSFRQFERSKQSMTEAAQRFYNDLTQSESHMHTVELEKQIRYKDIEIERLRKDNESHKSSISVWQCATFGLGVLFGVYSLKRLFFTDLSTSN